MRRHARLTALGIALSLGTASMAQNADFGIRLQRLVDPPFETSALAMVDGQLMAIVGGVPMVAQRARGELTGFWPDTIVGREDQEADFVVQRPGTQELYYTRIDRQGSSRLYLYSRQPGRKARSKKLKMNGMSVHHPAFNRDGNIMVFASRDGENALGGFDLWYCTADEEGWSTPRNLGRRINTKNDDFAPTICGDYLIFSSNGREGDNLYYQLYASRLVAPEPVGDTVAMVQVGVMDVQRLPEPLNMKGSDDFCFVADSVENRGYWLSRRDGRVRIYGFEGNLEGTELWGRATDRGESPLEGVRVEARRDGALVCSTTTAADGYYSLYLQRGESYEVRFSQEGAFSRTQHIVTPSSDTINLYNEVHLDAPMSSLALGQTLQLNDIFLPGASIEVDRQARTVMEPLVQFLCDNPTYSVQGALYCDATGNSNFNRMLTEKRMAAIEEYLRENLPQTVEISLRNGCQSGDMCATASGLSRMTVVLNKPSAR